MSYLSQPGCVKGDYCWHWLGRVQRCYHSLQEPPPGGRDPAPVICYAKIEKPDLGRCFWFDYSAEKDSGLLKVTQQFSGRMGLPVIYIHWKHSPWNLNVWLKILDLTLANW